MFGKRALVVQAVKTEKVTKTEEDKDEVSVGAHVAVLMEQAVFGAALLIGTYMAADTIRHCLIHTVAVKVQPAVIIEAATKK